MVEGAPHTAKRSTDQLVYLWGPPSPVYKGVEEGEGPVLLGAPQGCLHLPPFDPLIRGQGAPHRHNNRSLIS